MKVELDAVSLQWQHKAREFTDNELIPFEVEAELNEGRIPADLADRHQRIAIELGLSAMDVPKRHGGLELRIVDQVAVWEQLGRVTNALAWCFSEPQDWMFEACSDAQLEEFILPMMRGKRHECYAITESESGSEVIVNTTARREGDEYVIDGEKWFVTGFNHSDFMFVQAKLTEGPHAGTVSR
jgi:alkylation response protein AidB-like acyl-CoA dehydrogenase